MKNIIHQNYSWFFKETFEESDLDINNFKGFHEVNLPHTNKETPLNNFDETISHLTSTYKKIINFSKIDKLVHLVFEGIGHYSKLYVNGSFVAEHKCGYTRFEVDITNYITIGDNEITVVVDSHEINQPPFGFVIDYLCFGGIYRNCYLRLLNSIYIEDYYFHNDNKKWYLDYKLNKNCDHKIQVIISEDNKEIYNNIYNSNEVASENIENIVWWDLNNPKLYDLTINLFINDKIVDTQKNTIGFRTIRFEEKGFYLNEKKIKIRGVNRHQSYPYVGYAMPKRAQEEDAKLIKELGFNAVRTSHYPQSPDFIKACDEIGLLVFEEIPGWQNVGDESWQEIAIKNVKDMINRDKNNPSIILWGVRINESGDYHDFYTKTNSIAHELDKYRPTGGVRCFTHSELLEDIYTYNDFCNTGLDIHLREKEFVTSSNKPYLVSEYGGHMFPTKSFDNETRRTTHSMIHASVIDKALHDDKILATFAWCFADYNTHKDFGSGDLICYHGVSDIFRNPKYASYPYMVYKPAPFLEVSSNFNIGEHNGGYIREVAMFTNCDVVKMYHQDKLINTFDIKKYGKSFLLTVDELLGDILIKYENESLEDDRKIKEAIKYMLKFDGVTRKEITDKYDVTLINKAWNYYGKYISNWGSRASAYLFEGYINNKKVIEKYKGPQSLDYIKVTTSTTTLNTKIAYDVCKITLEAIGTLGNRVDYAFDSFKISTNENLEIIGDSIISLIGGVRSFYVKTKTLEGTGIIKIESDQHKINPIILQITN